MIRRLRTALVVRALDTRIVPAVYKVLSLADSGPNTLRDFIGQANANPGADLIHFNLALFTFESKTITLTTGDLDVSDPLTINGPGASKLTVSGNNASRIFDISSTEVLETISISGITMTKGDAYSPSGGINSWGGAILGIGEQLVLNNCVLTNNKAEVGGAVSMHGGGTFTANNCTFTNNISGYQGGAINADSSVTTVLKSCAVTGNNANISSAGGGIFAAHHLLIENCTIAGNTAKSGGGIFVGDSYAAGTFTIRNSTLTGNSAVADGGGIHLFNSVNNVATLMVQNCTITSNAATDNGGGLARSFGTGVVQLDSTIIAQNTSGKGTRDLSFNTPTMVNANNCIIGVADKGNFGLNGPGNQNGMLATPLNAKLGLLANNGGPTLTCALLPGSPAINFGANSQGLLSDQRGPGYLRTSGATADVGAYEYQQPAKVSAVQINDGTPQRSRVTNLRVTFDAEVTLPANPADAFQLARQSDSAAVSLSAVVAGAAVTLTFDFGPLDVGSLADGRYTLTVLAAQIPNFDGDGNGTAGGNYVLVGDPAVAPKFFRLFGDADGDNDVDTSDFGAFRSVFGGVSTIFDFDNDGDVDTSDFGAFRARFGASV